MLTTYGTLRRDAVRLAEHPWALVVADEAQHVKNPSSGTAKALRTVPAQARVALTGTPVENNLSELWAILDWTTPGLLGRLGSFRNQWAQPIEADKDEEVAARLAKLVRPFLLRRKKSDPGIAPELPPKTETDQTVSLTREQAVLYEATVRELLDEVQASDQMARRGLIVKLLTGLKQICNHPAQYLKEADDARLTGRSGKLELLDELLETIIAEDGAVLVFTQYVAMARLLERHLADRGIPTQLLHGGTPVARARGDGRPVPGRRGAGVPAVAEGGRDRAEPDPRGSRRALRPLVESGGRGPGDRPGVPDRADPAGAGPPIDCRRHHRGPDRRNADQPNASWPTPCCPAARRR